MWSYLETSQNKEKEMICTVCKGKVRILTSKMPKKPCPSWCRKEGCPLDLKFCWCYHCKKTGEEPRKKRKNEIEDSLDDLEKED
jgi:hypothetical protein